MTLWKTPDGVSLDTLAEEATPEDVIDFVRQAVESGTIKGEVAKLCRTHEGGIKTIGLTDERCHRRFGSVVSCEFDEGLVISDGGEDRP